MEELINETKNIDIIKTICKELGKPESFITYVTNRKGHDMHYGIDSAKIHDELGWLPEIKFKGWYLENRECWETIISGSTSIVTKRMKEDEII